MKIQKPWLVLLSVTVAVALALPSQARDEKHRSKHKVVEISDSRIKFEINSTDEDGGIQIFLDAEPWRTISIYDPMDRRVFRSRTAGSIGANGGTELFLESGEPEFSELSLEELLERFPAGTYHFRGRGIEGERLVGSGVLTHDLPDGPVLVYPLEDSGLLDPGNVTLMWEGVGPANGSPIIAYQVLVVQETELVALPKVSLDVMMPPAARSLIVPPGFLLPDTEYEWEVLAIESGGNQTLSSAFFMTAP